MREKGTTQTRNSHKACSRTTESVSKRRPNTTEIDRVLLNISREIFDPREASSRVKNVIKSPRADDQHATGCCRSNTPCGWKISGTPRGWVHVCWSSKPLVLCSHTVGRTKHDFSTAESHGGSVKTMVTTRLHIICFHEVLQWEVAKDQIDDQPLRVNPWRIISTSNFCPAQRRRPIAPIYFRSGP